MASGLSPISNPWLANFLSNASLQGTLGPEGVLTQQQAQQQQLLDQLAQQSAQAAQSQQQASDQYQQAAQAPIPQVSPTEQFINRLGGNVASVLGQNPAYAQRATQRLSSKQDDLMRARTENLMSLRDIYDQRARAAEHLGDVTTAEKFRQNSERMAMTLQKMQDKAALDQALAKTKNEETPKEKYDREQAGRVALANLEHQNRMNEANAKAGQGGDFNPQDYIDIRQSPAGKDLPYIDTSKIPSIKQRQLVTDYARKNRIPVLGEREKSALQLLDTVRGDMQYVTDEIVPKLPTAGGLTRVGGGLANQFKAAAQTDPVLAGYPAIRTAAIKTVQAIGALGKGLRINQAEINAAMNFDYPRIDDSQQTAAAKFKILHMMMDHIDQAAMGNPPSEKQVAEVLKSIRLLKAGKTEPSKPAAAPSQPDQVLMKTKSGKLFHVDSGKVDEAKQNGLVPA